MPIARRKTHALMIGSGLAVGAFAIAACQQVMQPRDAAAGLMVQGYGLHYVDTGEAAKLAYGKANSDNVGLMLECDKGSRTLEISDIARGRDRLVLRSKGQHSAFAGEIASGPGAPVLVATGATNAPALRAFRETGKVEVGDGAVRYNVQADSAERADVERFFKACERAV